MSALPRVSLILLNWNGRQFLEACLSALFELDYPDFSVLVIDNASTDGSVQFIRQYFPQVEVHCNERNVGFAAGNNIGLRQLETDIAVVLNPDTVVSRDWLRKLIGPMVEDDTIGIAGCKVYYPGGNRLQHAGGYITYPQAMPGHYGLNEEDQRQHDFRRDVDYVIGAALAVKRETLDKIGLFDEGYFLYFEDADLCIRARRTGDRVVYIPQASLIHIESATSHKDSEAYLRHIHTSRWRFLLKHYDFDDVFRDAIPAERSWLASCASSQRRAAAHAYRATLRNLSDIWQARIRDGGPHMKPVTEDQNRQIAQRLQALREAAWQPPEQSPPTEAETQITTKPSSQPYTLDKLHTKWQVQERPFVSHMPIIGPVIVRIRELWNSVSTKWYVRLLFQQQNEFNALLVQHLTQVDERFHEVDERFHEVDERLIDDDRDGTVLARQVAELTYTLVRLEKRLEELEIRLDKVSS